MFPQFPFYRQTGELDCGVTCLKMISKYFGKSISSKAIHDIVPICEDGVSLKALSDAAEYFGMKTMGVKVTYDRLTDDLPTPCIAFWKKQHFVVIYRVSEEYIYVADPATYGICMQSKEIFKDGWICDEKDQTGVLLLFEPKPEFYTTEICEKLEASV